MKKILIGATGSVATIKLRPLVEALAPEFELKVVLTRSAEYFLDEGLEAFLKSSGIALLRDQDEWPARTGGAYQPGKEPILHIELRRWADCYLIAPLDANTLAKLSHGLCDNLLTSVARAWDYNKALVVCPAMNTQMWENPPTVEQVAVLEKRGIQVLYPIAKQLACNDIGIGAMVEVEDIVQRIRAWHGVSHLPKVPPL